MSSSENVMITSSMSSTGRPSSRRFARKMSLILLAKILRFPGSLKYSTPARPVSISSSMIQPSRIATRNAFSRVAASISRNACAKALMSCCWVWFLRPPFGPFGNSSGWDRVDLSRPGEERCCPVWSLALCPVHTEIKHDTYTFSCLSSL